MLLLHKAHQACWEVLSFLHSVKLFFKKKLSVVLPRLRFVPYVLASLSLAINPRQKNSSQLYLLKAVDN